MLAQLSSKASFSARFRPTLRVKSVTKAKHAKSSLCAQKIALFSPIPCIRATLGHEAAKNILRTSIFIQKRGHAGCGMPHAGDEVPGVGMERELRAHLNVTHLNIVDTSGSLSSVTFRVLFLLSIHLKRGHAHSISWSKY